MSGSANVPPLGDVVTRLPVGELTWDDLVVEPEVRHRLLSLGDSVPAGGLVVVIAGPVGVGKTFAARVWAESLRLDLWRVDCTLLSERHGTQTGSRGLDEMLAFGRRPPGVLLLDRPDVLIQQAGSVLFERLASRRAPTVLEIADTIPASLPELPVVAIDRPGVGLRRALWRRLVERASPLAEVDYDTLASLALTGAQIDAAVRAVVLAHGDEHLETEALLRAASA